MSKGTVANLTRHSTNDILFEITSTIPLRGAWMKTYCGSDAVVTGEASPPSSVKNTAPAILFEIKSKLFLKTNISNREFLLTKIFNLERETL